MTNVNEDVPTETETLNNETETLNNETDILENETETLNNETQQPTKPKPKHIPPINKKRERLPPAKLSTVERNKILYDYDRGVYDPVWEVVITKTNKKIVRRRKIPLTQPETNISHESVVNSSTPPSIQSLIKTQTPPPLPQTSTSTSTPQNKEWMASIQYYNVQNSFNEQLMKQIDELNNKITHQNNKHKKLKTKYKKLKRSIFSDDSEDEPEPININQPAENANLDTSPEGLKAHGATSINESINEYEEVTPIPKRKLNLRDTIDFTKYGFSPI